MWDFKDYPMETWKIPNALGAKPTFRAGLSGWQGLMGDGATEEQAIAELKQRFSSYKERNTTLPRPGTYVPLKFASTDQISKYYRMADDFFKNVLNEELGVKMPLFVSDISRLPNYEPRDEEQAQRHREEVIARTSSVYGVDITDIYDGPLYGVLGVIQRTTGRAGTQEKSVLVTLLIRHPGWSPAVSAVSVVFFLAVGVGIAVGSVWSLIDAIPDFPQLVGLVMLPGSAFFFYMGVVGICLFRFRNVSIEVDEGTETMIVNCLGKTTSYRYDEVSYRATDWLRVISIFDKRTRRRLAMFDYDIGNTLPLVVWSRKHLGKQSSAF